MPPLLPAPLRFDDLPILARQRLGEGDEDSTRFEPVGRLGQHHHELLVEARRTREADVAVAPVEVAEVAEVAGERVHQRLEPTWLLHGRCHPGELKAKVRYVGRAMGWVALALGCATPDHGAERELEEQDESEQSGEAEQVDDA